MSKLFEIEKEEHYITLNKGTVTCILTVKKINAYGIVPDSMGCKAEDEGCAAIEYAKIAPNRYRLIGRSKCNPEDKFDEKIGETIARSRAYIKYDRLVQNFIKPIRKQIARDFIELTRMKNKRMHDENFNESTLRKLLGNGAAH